MLYIVRQLAARINELSESLDNNKLHINLTDEQANLFNYMIINEYEMIRQHFKQYGLYIELYIADISYLKIESSKSNDKSIVNLEFNLIYNRLAENAKTEYLKHLNIVKYLINK